MSTGLKVFFANLNVFVACFGLLMLFGTGTSGFFLSSLVTPFGATAEKFFSDHVLELVALLYGVLLLTLWWKGLLAPRVRVPEREPKYEKGQTILAITNVIVGLSVALPFVSVYTSGKSENVLYLYWAIPVIGVGFITWLIGLVMVWSSKASKSSSYPKSPSSGSLESRAPSEVGK